MENPPVQPPNWDTLAIVLTNKCKSGEIMRSNIEELELYLLTTDNATMRAITDRDREKHAVLLRQLIQLRTTTGIAERSSASNRLSRRIAWIAVVVSGLSLIASAYTAIFKKTVNNIPVPSVTNNVSMPAGSTVITNIIVINTNLFRNP